MEVLPPFAERPAVRDEREPAPLHVKRELPENAAGAAYDHNVYTDRFVIAQSARPIARNALLLCRKVPNT